MSVDAQLEPLASRWWPAAETVPIGPWLLRHAGGFTGRANSVGVFGEVEPDQIGALVDEAERWYAERGLPPRFQVADTPRTKTVREALATRGYEPTVGAGHVHVMVLDALPHRDGAGVTHRRDPDGPWIERWWSVSPRGDLLDAGVALLRRVPRPRSFARIGGGDGLPDAVGLGAVVDGWVGIGAVAVAPAARRRRLGRRLTEALLAWGLQAGATRSFLQVSSNNHAAIRLYESLGFHRAYDYRYWVRR